MGPECWVGVGSGVGSRAGSMCACGSMRKEAPCLNPAMAMCCRSLALLSTLTATGCTPFRSALYTCGGREGREWRAGTCAGGTVPRRQEVLRAWGVCQSKDAAVVGKPACLERGAATHPYAMDCHSPCRSRRCPAPRGCRRGGA